MREKTVLFRTVASVAIAGTLLTASASPVRAQAASPTADPPARVGRLAAITGTVSFHTADQQQWGAATLNYPVTSGNAFWTEPSSAARIEVGATHLALDQSTEFDLDTLDDSRFVATAPQGNLYLRIDAVNPGETYTVRTPRGVVSIATAGRYEITGGDTDQPTRITVVEGAAQISGDSTPALAVGPHQTASLTGAGPFQDSVGAEADDRFLAAQLQAERPAPAAAAPPSAVAQMTGASDLSNTGSWTEAPQYGRVWYPPVEAGWKPYRHGHWAYVAPWGWTWIDDAPWGFAPYHYGRWVEVDDRWGWVPAAPEAPVDVAPVYSPALVDFVGIAAGVAVGAAIGVGVGLALGGGHGGGNVGWVPLGFREPYIPPYGGSAGYVNRINSPNFNRTENIGSIVNQRRSFLNNSTINRNVTTINNYYANAGGATVAPRQVLQTGQPVAGFARPVSRQQFAQVARPALTPGVQPMARTPGITPAVARQHGIPPAQLVRAAAPGPELAARPAGHVPLPQAAGHPAAIAGPALGRPVAPVPPTLAAPRPPAVAAIPQPSAPVGRLAPGPVIVPRALSQAASAVHAPLPTLAPHEPPHAPPPNAAAPRAVPLPPVAAPRAVPPSPAIAHAPPPAQAPRAVAPVRPPAPAAQVVHAAPRPAPPPAPHVQPPPAPRPVPVQAAHVQPAPQPRPPAPRPPAPHSAPPPPHKACPAGHPC